MRKNIYEILNAKSKNVGIITGKVYVYNVYLSDEIQTQ